MRLTGGAGVLFGEEPRCDVILASFICAVQQASSESKIIHRKSNPTPTSPTNLEEIGRLVAQIHSLSDPKVQGRSSLDPLPVDGTDINAYYSIISTLYVLLQPLMREGFVQDLPQTLVCILSERQDCGTEAELIRTVSTEMGPAFLTVLRSLTSPTCSSLGAEGKSYSFFKTYLHMSDSTVETLSEIQDMFFDILTYFPGAGDLVNAVSGLVDTMMKYVLEVLFSLLEVPIEYVMIALQIGIRVPTLDEQGMCEHGDLKQLIMWGLRHNVSWSFSTAFIDILLDMFLAPDQYLCSPPGFCPPSTGPLQRSYLESNTDIYHNILLQCNHQHLAKLNDTICPEIISGLRQPSSAFVLMLCQALSSLNARQIESVWRNGCYIFEAVMSPLASRTASNCPFIGPFPSPGFYAAHTVSPLEEVPLRIVREASNLNQLACNYNSWMNNILVDPVLVSLCGDNQHPLNAWLRTACNDTEEIDKAHLIQQVCRYTEWTKPTIVDMTEVAVCAEDLAKKFNWTCTQDLTRACLPGVGQNAMLQVVVRCWLETMRSRMEEVLTPQVTTMLDQAVSLAVVSLLALEEIQNTTYHVAQNIRLNVLMTVDKFLKKETNFDKKRVMLQCFGRVLTSLMQTPRGAAQEDFVFFQEFFNIPVDTVREVLSGSHISTIRMLLVYYSRHKNSLQLPQKYLPTLASVLFQTHLFSDVTLFSELAPLLTLTSPSDILAMPLLQKDNEVREIINLKLNQMTLEQRLAFGAWFGTALDPITIIRGQQSLIRAIGNLSAYLPFYYFQHLSAAQLLDGLDVLMNNTLSPIKQGFIAQRVIGTYSNLTAQDFIRLGNITCHADPEDLIAYNGTKAFPVIQEAIRNCTRNGLNLPSRLLSLLLLNGAQSKDPSTMTAEQSSETAHLLPMLGVSYIQSLSPQHLLHMLPVIKTVTFSPAQASVIVEKLSSVVKLNSPGTLQQLGSLVVGVKSEFLLTLTSEKLLSSLPSMAQQTPKFNPAQANAISTKLWGFLDVPSWLDEVEPLLLSTPLVSVMSRTVQLVNNLSTTATKPWNTQQAQAIFNKVLDINPSLIKEDFQSLGTLGHGVSCKVLLERMRANKSPSSVRKILYFLRQQLSPLHTTLKTCVVNEVNNYDFFIDVLKDFGAELALSIPLSIIRHFDVNYMDSLREIIIREPQYFLKLSRRKQELLVDRIVQRLSMSTDGTSKMDIVAQMLQITNSFGPVETWTKATLSQVGRFIFFLPINKLQQIPLELMSVTGIERLFMSQQQWEQGPVGSQCLDASEKRSNFEKQQFVLQFFLGFLKVIATPTTVPTCEILHSTTPSVWTPNSLANMSSSAFVNCLELMGLDPFVSYYHRVQLLQKLKKLYGPVSSFSQSLISQLGRIAVEMTNEELRSLQLSDRNIISALGAVDLWTRTQQEILFAAVLTSTQQSVSQLDSSLLVAMGHFVCGAKASQIIYFNAVEFSKAVLYLGQLKLQCDEEQLRAMIGLLSHALAFGLVPFWKSDVFMEIGIIAAGLTDIDMSSLVKDQIEGITPLAISAVPPTKFSVAFRPHQISMFSYDQADAVPIPVIDALSYMQKQALAMVLNPWEDRLVDFRGRSLALALSPCPVCVLLGSLMLMLQT
uniref:Stereocilin LRR domain-containing protein n=1 Tax=Knipowitschia caucasica TaxID=637954 RepID=A0AAV2LU93_KNICA